MNQMECPQCKGKIEFSEHSSTVVCPYCGTTVQVLTKEILKEHYMMRLQYGPQQSKERLISWTAKQLGAPKDLDAKAEVKARRLAYWPFWVVEVEAVADYAGTQRKPDFGASGSAGRFGWKTVPESGHIDIERDIFIPAHSKVPVHLRKYMIPTRRKEFLKRELVLESGGSLEDTQVRRNEAIELAQREMGDVLRKEALKEVDSIKKMDSKLKVPAVFLVHVPVWHLKYSYMFRNYEALVDGASGRVIYSQFPRRVAFRANLMLNGLVQLGVGGGIGLILMYIGITRFDLIFPTILGAVFGLGMLAFGLRFIQTAFSLKAGEETAG
ncbi:MAG: hypothetical protein C4K49_12180 [Candidatus Thorarchaeota archaeon]|nr:MAG: hypothetical protein C4K49_12180 [Candidatus Thorarchaeota archaeon]